MDTSRERKANHPGRKRMVKERNKRWPRIHNRKGADQRGIRPPNSAPKPFTSRFTNYTPLNTSREQILIQVEGRNLFQNPGPMKAPLE